MFKILLVLSFIFQSVSSTFQQQQKTSLRKIYYLFQQTVTISRIDQELNKEVVKITLALFGKENEDTFLNVTAEIFQTLIKLMLNFKLFLPEGTSDREYKKLFFHTSIDIEKLLENKYGSFIIRAAVENLRKSIDFEPKFPFKAVRTKHYI